VTKKNKQAPSKAPDILDVKLFVKYLDSKPIRRMLPQVKNTTE